MDKEIRIKDKNGKPIWFAKVEVEYVSLEFEAFADTHGGANVETIYSIAEDQYQQVIRRYEFQQMPIDQVLQAISDNGQGKDFVTWSIQNQIALKAFTWVSYGD
jgi:hypothetical protein